MHIRVRHRAPSIICAERTAPVHEGQALRFAGDVAAAPVCQREPGYRLHDIRWLSALLFMGSPRPCSKMSKFSSVPSSLGLYTNGTEIADDFGGVLVLGVVFEDSRSVISVSEAIAREL